MSCRLPDLWDLSLSWTTCFCCPLERATKSRFTRHNNNVGADTQCTFYTCSSCMPQHHPTLQVTTVLHRCAKIALACNEHIASVLLQVPPLEMALSFQRVTCHEGKLKCACSRHAWPRRCHWQCKTLGRACSKTSEARSQLCSSIVNDVSFCKKHVARS